MVPLYNRVGEAGSGVTEIPKSQGQATPPTGIIPTSQLASLHPNEVTSIADDVVFSVEEPSSAKKIARAEALMTSSAKGLMPREAIGSKALREASSSGDSLAQ